MIWPRIVLFIITAKELLKSIILSLVSTSVVNTLAKDPAAYNAHIMKDKFPVLLFLQFCLIWSILL